VKCALAFLENEYMTPNSALTLQYYRASYYRWEGTHFAEVDEQDVRAALYAFLNEAITTRAGGFEPFKPTKAKVNGILDALQSGVLQSRNKVVPFWLEPEQDRNTDGVIACRNGLLNLAARELRPHSPYLFNINCLPFDYDPTAPKPERWLQFLDDLWPDDGDAQLTLQEIFGLLLTPETKHHKIFMLVGPKRSGKGTIARLLPGLLGKDNVVSPTLAGLSSHFGLAPLIDKRAAIISDARLGPQNNAHTVAERLLAISGDDPLTIDRKCRDAWTGHLGVRFLILTNELPRIADASGALASRFVLLTMRRSFYDEEDLDLTTALLEELPGIMNWALRGLDRLNKRGRFEVPQSSLQAIRQLGDLASPMGAFIRDWCTVKADSSVGVKQLYAAYSSWCEQEGHRPLNNSVFGRDLRAALPDVLARGRGADRYYQGVGLSALGKEEYMGAARPRR
jgi:putative DNA primase/helicase